jgi:hypothetical protein
LRPSSGKVLDLLSHQDSYPNGEKAQGNAQKNIAGGQPDLAVAQVCEGLQTEGGKGGEAAEDSHQKKGAHFRSKEKWAVLDHQFGE